MNWQAYVLNKMGDLETKHPIQCSDSAMSVEQMYNRWDELRAFLFEPPNKEVKPIECIVDCPKLKEECNDFGGAGCREKGNKCKQ